MSAVRLRISRRVISLIKCTVSKVARASRRLENVGESLRVHCAVAPTWTHWDSEKKGAVHSIRTLLVTGTCRGATAGSVRSRSCGLRPKHRSVLADASFPWFCLYVRISTGGETQSPTSNRPPLSPQLLMPAFKLFSGTKELLTRTRTQQ